MNDLLGFLLAGLALIASPGPATLSLAATGAAFGARRGAGYMAGLLAGLVIVMGLVASGLVGLFLALPGAAPVVTALAALYFVYLAWRIATAPPLTEARAGRGHPSFLAGFILNLVNPKGYAAMAALFSGFVLLRDDLAGDAAAKTALLTVLTAMVNVAWLLAGAGLSRFFRDPKANRAINLAFAALLLASLAALL
jgi:threonine/homoserine/homoserine lactone efflux protein